MQKIWLSLYTLLGISLVLVCLSMPIAFAQVDDPGDPGDPGGGGPPDPPRDPVPEPATMMLMAVGAGGVYVYRKLARSKDR